MNNSIYSINSINNKQFTIEKHMSFFQKSALFFVISILAQSLLLQNIIAPIPNILLVLGIFMISMLGIDLFLLKNPISMIMPKEGWLFFLYLAYMLLAGIIFAQSKSMHIEQWITSFEYFLVMMVIIYVIMQTQNADVFILCQLILAGVSCIIFLINPVPYNDYTGDSARYSLSSYYNPNGFAMMLAMGIWTVLYLVSKKKLNSILGFVFCGIFTYAILMTGSRKGLICAVLCIITWILICYLPSGDRKTFLSILGKLAFIGAIMLAFLTILKPIYESSYIMTRIENLTFEITEGERSGLYRQAFSIIIEQPLMLIFGAGYANYEYIYGTYTHSTLAEVPFSGGLIGSVIYFSAYFVSIRKVILLMKNQTKSLEISSPNNQVMLRMILVLWLMMLFYTASIIHPYQLDSYVAFALIFSITRVVEKSTISSNSIINKNEGVLDDTAY